MLTQVDIGGVYHHKNDPTMEVMVTAVDYQKGEVHYKWLGRLSYLAPGIDPFHDFCVNAVQASQPPSQVSSHPAVGDIYYDMNSLQENEVVYVSSNGDVDLQSIGPLGRGPTYRITSRELKLYYYAHKNNSNGFPPGGGPQAAHRQGLAAWVPDPPKLPPGQSNEFFGVSMNGLLNKCTCGVDSIGGGNHSSWCDKKENVNELTVETIQKAINHAAKKP